VTLIRIRPADAGDKNALKSLLDLSWLTHWAPHVHAASVERYRGERPAHGYVDSRWQNFMVAERDGVVLGMYDLDASYLHAVHVHPEAIGNGLGKALMDHAEKNGAAVLDVRIFNKNAMNFYQHRGWKKTEECDASEMGTPTRSITMVLPRNGFG